MQIGNVEGLTVKVQYSWSDEVAAAVAAIGRTEDVQFSPDNTRLVIAGFGHHYLLILDVLIAGGDAGAPFELHFSRATKVNSHFFSEPHGVAWIDNETLIVGNRHAAAPIIHVPRFLNSQEVQVHPVHLLGTTEADRLNAPGSVAARPISDDLIEVLICNNRSHEVTRHLLDATNGLAVISSEVAFRADLDIPDGVAFSCTGKWVAVSNHHDNSVFIYPTDQIGVSDRPVCVLRGMAYPHGITFTPDDRAIFVADAGAPVVHVFTNAVGEWSGTKLPSASVDVVDKEAFQRINGENLEDGGTKGAVLTSGGQLLCVTCEQEPLFFFDTRMLLKDLGVPPREASKVVTVPPSLRELLHKSRRGIVDLGSRAMEAERNAREAEARARAAEERAAHLESEISNLQRGRAWALVQWLRRVRRRLPV